MYLRLLTNMVLAMLTVYCSSVSAFADATSTVLKPTNDSRLLVTNELKSGNSDQVDKAITQIKAWLSIEQVPQEIYLDWVPALINHRRYQDAADLSLAGALARPDIRFITPLMVLRTNSLLDLGNYEQALEAAKSYYNVCYMNQTNNAIQLVAQCFAELHLDVDGIDRQFINEQAIDSDGMANLPTVKQSTSQPTPEPMLKTVQIDQSLFIDAMQKWKARSLQSGKFSDIVSYANVLLAADKTNEAEKIFKMLEDQAATQDELNTAVEGIARSMRAEDGNVSRANAWLLSLENGQKSD